MNITKLQPWEVIKTHEVYSANPWVKVTVQEIRLPDGRVVPDYHQIKLQDYVMIFAQAPDGRILIERQYKHAVGKVTLTLPAGTLEAGEDPMTAAKRELLEETGYTSDDWQALGTFIPHGSYGCGQASPFIARNIQKVAEPNSGDLEDMEIIKMHVDDLWKAVQAGELPLWGNIATIALAAKANR